MTLYSLQTLCCSGTTSCKTAPRLLYQDCTAGSICFVSSPFRTDLRICQHLHGASNEHFSRRDLTVILRYVFYPFEIILESATWPWRFFTMFKSNFDCHLSKQSQGMALSLHVCVKDNIWFIHLQTSVRQIGSLITLGMSCGHRFFSDNLSCSEASEAWSLSWPGE